MIKLLKKEHIIAIKDLEVTIDENNEDHGLTQEHQISLLKTAKEEKNAMKVINLRRIFMNAWACI